MVCSVSTVIWKTESGENNQGSLEEIKRSKAISLAHTIVLNRVEKK